MQRIPRYHTYTELTHGSSSDPHVLTFRHSFVPRSSWELGMSVGVGLLVIRRGCVSNPALSESAQAGPSTALIAYDVNSK
jgi:hypothetical protein